VVRPAAGGRSRPVLWTPAPAAVLGCPTVSWSCWWWCSSGGHGSPWHARRRRAIARPPSAPAASPSPISIQPRWPRSRSPPRRRW
jgi:hypothetical protein